MKTWERAHESSRVAVGFPALVHLGDRLVESLGPVTAIYRLDDGRQSVERITEVGAYGVVAEDETFQLRHRLNAWWWLADEPQKREGE